MDSDPVRVLVVDDDEARARRWTEVLAADASARWVTSTASTLAAAVRRLEEDRFAVVLLDLTLPDAGGLDVLSRIRTAAPALPVIVLAAADDDPVAFQALRAGAQDVLSDSTTRADALLRTIEFARERQRFVADLERVLSTRRASIRNALSQSPDGILVLNESGTIAFANPKAVSLLAPPDRALPLIGTEFPRRVTVGESQEIQLGEIFLELSATPLDWEQAPATLVTLRDLSDRKRSEDLKLRLIHADRLAAIGQLAAGVAHEVNNPAAFILANQTMIRESVDRVGEAVAELRAYAATFPDLRQRERVLETLSKEAIDDNLLAVAEMLDDNMRGMQRIRGIVRDLRTFSRLEESDVEDVQLAEVVEAACGMVSNEVRHRARLLKDIGRLPPLVGDRGKLAQVVMNLLMNATQAIEGGAADQNQIKVSAHEIGGNIVVSVEDTGVGMSDEVQARAFEPFFTTKPREVGTGLGLSLCADIVRKHGGEIRVVSAPGRGARFDVILPIHTSLVSAKAEVKEPILDAPGVAARILIIDDEPTLLTAYRRMLEPPHLVTLAQGGAAGLAILAERSDFDLVLCDLMMPDVDGPRVYERVREMLPGVASRLVFCTGGAFTPRAREFMKQVSNTFLEKPATRQQLLALIETFGVKA